MLCLCNFFKKSFKFFHDFWNENGENAVRFCVKGLGKAYITKPHAQRRACLKIGMHRLSLVWLRSDSGCRVVGSFSTILHLGEFPAKLVKESQGYYSASRRVFQRLSIRIKSDGMLLPTITNLFCPVRPTAAQGIIIFLTRRAVKQNKCARLRANVGPGEVYTLYLMPASGGVKRGTAPSLLL